MLSTIPTGQTHIGKLIRLPLRLIPPQSIIPILSGPLRGMRWVAGASTHGCWIGNYEHEKQLLFSQTITPGSVVYDIGAQAGYYSLLASKLVGEAGRVIAFEPLPKNIASINQHLELNTIKNVTLIKAAVSNTNGYAQFSTAMSASMGRLSEEGEIEVSTVSIDTLVRAGQIPRPDFIKMDIEGAEGSALLGGIDTLKTKKPTIFLATHGQDVHRQCISLLTTLGYKITTLSSPDELLAVA